MVVNVAKTQKVTSVLQVEGIKDSTWDKYSLLEKDPSPKDLCQPCIDLLANSVIHRDKEDSDRRKQESQAGQGLFERETVSGTQHSLLMLHEALDTQLFI
jgi:hypothetical protein